MKRVAKGRMPMIDDDMDVACYAVEWKEGDKESTLSIDPVSSQQLEDLPEWVTDSININMICEHKGITYGPTEDSLKGGSLWGF